MSDHASRREGRNCEGVWRMRLQAVSAGVDINGKFAAVTDRRHPNTPRVVGSHREGRAHFDEVPYHFFQPTPH